MYRQVNLLNRLRRAGLALAGGLMLAGGAAPQARAQAAGSVDTTFNPGGAGAGAPVNAVVLRSTGQFVIGGEFQTYNNAPANYFVRLATNGTPTGIPLPCNGPVNALALGPNNTIILGGAFTSFANNTVGRLARLNAIGNYDVSFTPDGGAGGDVHALAVYTNGTHSGKLVVGGEFYTMNGAWRPFLARLNANGSLDTAFSAAVGPDNAVYAIALQADGKILIGGAFMLVNNEWRPRIARLNDDGTLDTAFDPGAGPGDSVYAVAVQSDGKVVIGGYFTEVNLTNRNRLARLNADGSLDTAFLDGMSGIEGNGYLEAVAVQPDGKILAGGEFTTVNGLPRNRLVRLGADGSVDSTITFGSGPNGSVLDIVVQPDGDLVAAGGFTAFNDTPAGGIVRLHGGATAGSGTLAFAAPAFSVHENAGHATLTVRRTGGLNGAVSVQFAATNGTALPGTHYTPTNGVLTFEPGQEEQTFRVAVWNETDIVSNKTVHLVLHSPEGGATLGTPATATLSIVNEDGIASLRLPNFFVVEGDEAAVIRIDREGGVVEAASVQLVVGGGTANSGIDYTGTVFQANFPVHESEATVRIPIADDTLVESSETVFLVLTNQAGPITLDRAFATLTIFDNDFGAGSIEFASEYYSALEGDGVARVKLVRRDGVSGRVSVSYETLEDIARPGLDYVAKTDTVTFPIGVNEQFITIDLLDDPITESNETFGVRLANPTGGATLGRSDAVVKIVDDEYSPGATGWFEMDAATYSVYETDGSLDVMVRRVGGTNGELIVTCSAVNGTATAQLDFRALNSVLVFAPGEVAKTINLPVFNDTIGEGNEYFYIRLESTNAVVGMPNYAMVTIIEDDMIPGDIGFAFENYNVLEGAAGQVTYAGILLIRTNGLTGPVRAYVTARDGTATNEVDYYVDPFDPQIPVEFADGQSTARIQIPVVGNGSTNANLVFYLELGGYTNTSPDLRLNASVTMLDDDYQPDHPGVFSFESASYTTNEGAGAVRITIVRQYGKTGKVDVRWTTREQTATTPEDYRGGTTNTVTFDDDDTRKTITVALVDNEVLDGSRYFETLLLTNGLATNASLGLKLTEVTLTDDDRHWGDVRFVGLNYTVDEGGTNYAAITVGRYGGNYGYVTVDYFTSDGTAHDGVDYSRAAGTLVLPPVYYYPEDDGYYYYYHDWMATYATFLVPIHNDALTNGARTVVLNLANLSYLYEQGGAATLSEATATLTIFDDESRLIPEARAGEFVFSSPYYCQTDREGDYYYYDYAYAYYYYYGYGAMVTIVRTNGARGRVMVDWEILDPTNPLGLGYEYGYYGLNKGTVVFDDYQMSTNFFVGYGYYYYYGDDFDDHHLVVQLSNPRGAPGEPTPTLGPLNTAHLAVYDTSSSFNFVNAVTRVPEWAGRAWLGISRPDTNASVTVEWEAVAWRDYSWRYAYDAYYDESGTLQAGSDFALPPHGAHIGDYTPASGTLTWGANDYDIKEISIPITNDDEVEFNEDFFVYLRIPSSARGKPGEVLGHVSVATVTILADDENRLLDDETTDNGATPAGYRNEQPAGAVDQTWNRDRSLWVAEPNPRLNNAPGANNRVYAMAVQPDGKVILGGEFRGYNAVSRNRIARANAVGGIDLTFDPGTGADDYVAALALYTLGPHRGKIVMGGGFSSVNGQSRFGIARLNANGTLDSTFRPGSGANGPVRAVAIQNDGKVILGGDFTEFNGTNRNHIARLNADGSLDTTFDPGLGANGPVYAVVMSGANPVAFSRTGIDSDTNTLGGVYASGYVQLDCDFQTPANNLRVYYGGTLLVDTTFAGTQTLELPFTGGPAPLTLVVNEGLTNVAGNAWSYDGWIVPTGTAAAQVVLGGNFTTVNGVLRSGIARLNDDGSVDAGFDTGGGIDGIVYGVAVQSDRKVVMGGDFTTVNLKPRHGIARLNTDGRVDETFDPGSGFNDIVYAVSLQPDGKPLVGGLFTSFNGTRRMGLARLLTSGVLDTTFLDAAYNQFAGVVNPFSYDPPSFVSAVVPYNDGADDYVFIAGNFTRVGGGYVRDEVRYRNHVARLIGGQTRGPGNLEFTMDDYGADENGSFASFTLRRVNGDLGSVAADYVTRDLTAVVPDDYTNILGTAYWSSWGNQYSDGDTSPKIHQIMLLNDFSVEGDEKFSLALTNPASTLFLAGAPIPLGTALGRARAEFNIIDDDFAPGVLGFAEPVFIVNENGVDAVITLTRTNGATGVVTVDYSTEDFPAGINAATTNAPNPDYYARRGTRSFASGQTHDTFTIPIVDDFNVEFDEAIRLRLSLPTGGATLGLDDVQLLIVDNDFLPGRLNFTATNYVASEDAGAAVVTVSRSGGNLGALSVTVRTLDGTALQGLDYVATTNILVWTDNDSAPKAFLVPLLNDNRVDPLETILVHLENASVEGALGALTNAVVTVVDDDRYGTLVFGAPNFTANENGSSATITVVRSDGKSEPVTVSYFTTDATATGTDYTPVSGQLTFQDGETARSFTVPVLDDTVMDGTKIVLITLTNPSPAGALLGYPAVASLTLVDDESANVPAGGIDTSFRPVPGADGPVYALALQLDGDLLIGGDFQFVNSAARTRLARLHPDGTLDSLFDPGTGVNGTVRAMVLSGEGKAVIGGFFSMVNNSPRNCIARLGTSGIVDTSFNPGSGFDNPVYAVALQRVAGRESYLVGGSFTTFNGVNRNFIARLTDSGTLDTDFDPGLGANDTVFAIAVQPDGRVLIGGDFDLVHNTNRNHIARLHPNGALDLSFEPGAGPNASVRAIAVQTDGKIVLGGLFTNVHGVAWNHIARLNADGSVDTTFEPGEGADNVVYALALQDDGKILLGGDFTSCNGVTRNRITRLNTDGTVDPTINFGTGANSFIAALHLQTDGRIVIGGGFTRVNGVARNRVARLYGGSLSGSGSLEFSSPAYTALESDVNSVITVRRVGGTAGAVSVDYASFTNAAHPSPAGPNDYANVAGTLTFPPGETEQTFTVPVFDNEIVSPDRTVSLLLSNFVGAAPGPQPVATLTIVNDDSLVGFATPSFSVNENALGGRALISVSRTGSTHGAVVVDYAIVEGGTAAPGTDFAPVAGSLAFEPGVSNLSFTISILDDTRVEGNETVALRLNNPRGAVVLAQTNAFLTIVDNDFAPGEIVFERAAFGVMEDATQALVTVLRTNGSAGIVSAQYASTPGTAQPGFDYLAVSGIVNFADGQTIATFSVPILADTVVEDPETVRLQLFGATAGARVGTLSNAVLTITNRGGVPTPCSVDRSFDPGAGAAHDNVVHALSLMPDGKIVIGGGFTNFDGSWRAYVARLTATGAVDNTFVPAPGADAMVWCLTPQDDGKVLLGGTFTTLDGLSRLRVGRLTSDGVVDRQFQLPYGLDATVYAIASSSNGILIAGAFGNTPSPGIARLNPDGTLDDAFAAGAGSDGAVFAMLVQPDGRILVGGNFTRVNGVTSPRLARLLPTGARDPDFAVGMGIDGVVWCLALQDDGKILVGGDFVSYNGVTRQHIARLEPDGALDTAFAPNPGPNRTVYALAVQPNRQILIGGSFTSVNGVGRNRVTRLNADGSLDQDFGLCEGADNTVYALALQPDGKVLIAGDFTTVAGESRNGIARLHGSPVEGAPYRILSIQRVEGTVSVRIASQAGTWYVLESADTLHPLPPAWATVAARLATDTTLTLTDSTVANQAHRFYRVRRMSP